MSSFNKVLLMGNLTRDVQLKYLQNQTAVAEFGLAVNRRWKTQSGEDREDVTFVDVAAFGKQAETLNQYVGKGDPLFVEGRLKFDTWEDKQGGGKRQKLSVVLESFRFMGKAGGDAGGADDQRPPRNNPAASRQTQTTPAGRPPFSEEGPQDDDIPF